MQWCVRCDNGHWGCQNQSQREQTTAATLGSEEPCLVADRNLLQTR
jgi:hypothetical protein